MEPQPSTPPPDRPAAWTGHDARADAADDFDAATGAFDGADEGHAAREDWSARYGAPPPPPPPRSGPDFSGLFILLDGLRRAAPADLQARIGSLIREALLALRSLIDWYLERLDRGPREPEVQDIPIDEE